MKLRLAELVSTVKWYVRQLSGDAAYENYLQRVGEGNCCVGHARPPLSREEFYLDSLRRRYSGVSRCC